MLDVMPVSLLLSRVGIRCHAKQKIHLMGLYNLLLLNIMTKKYYDATAVAFMLTDVLYEILKEKRVGIYYSSV